MYRFNIPVPPDEDFPEVVVAQRMGEGFEKEYVEYEPRWRFDKRRRAVVVDEKFFYAMADTAERLSVENAKLRELVRDMWEGYNDPRCEECHLKDTPTCADCPICARKASVIDRMRELGVDE